MKNSRIGQLALVVSDLANSVSFYEKVLGLDAVFGTSAFRGELPSRIQGIKNAASSTHWLIDDRELFQLELFSYDHPQSRALPTGHGITDIGYNRLIIAVRSLQETLEQVASFNCETLAIPGSGIMGVPCHALVKDPDGILLELVEMPERILDQRPARMIGVGLTSENLATTVEDMCDGFGFGECADLFHHSSLWPENGRLECTQTLQLGDMFLIVSQYRESRARPTEYRLSDIGVMNFAICFPSMADFSRCYDRTLGMGMRGNCEPLIDGERACMVYNNDRQDFSVEMIYIEKQLWGLYGFAPPRWRDRLVNKLMEWKSHATYRKTQAMGS